MRSNCQRSFFNEEFDASNDNLRIEITIETIIERLP